MDRGHRGGDHAPRSASWLERGQPRRRCAPWSAGADRDRTPRPRPMPASSSSAPLRSRRSPPHPPSSPTCVSRSTAPSAKTSACAPLLPVRIQPSPAQRSPCRPACTTSTSAPRCGRWRSVSRRWRNTSTSQFPILPRRCVRSTACAATFRCSWPCQPTPRSGAAGTPASHRSERRSSRCSRAWVFRGASATTPATSRRSSRCCAPRRSRTPDSSGGMSACVRGSAPSRSGSWTRSLASPTPLHWPPSSSVSSTAMRTRGARVTSDPRCLPRTGSWPRAMACSRCSSTIAPRRGARHWDALMHLLDDCRPAAAQLGCASELERAAALARDPGATRQRRHADRAGLAALPALLGAEFAPNVSQHGGGLNGALAPA